MRRTHWLVPVLAFVVALAMAAPGSAQVFTGRVEVTVVDATGAMLPGVLVELTGPQNGSATTDNTGAARFLNLPPGTYQVKAVLAGFSDYVNNEVPVVAGGTMGLRATLRVAGVQEQVEVTAASPVIDSKKAGTATNVTLDELQNIPSSRDPWVVMQTVPGIIVDRVNVGGAESGQQSAYQAKGASGADATWNMDGIPITDMAATGASSVYYDFDMFQEMNVTTGGSDMTSPTGGVHLSFVLKSGTNTPHGSARVYFEDEGMQGNNMSADLAKKLGSPTGQGNRTSQYSDYGFEIGGPIIKDRLWGWGSLGKTDVRILTIRQTPDKTVLKNRSLKIQGQATQNLRAGFTYFFGDKNKWGRNASATRPPETTWDQKGPSNFYKGEVNYVIGNNLFLTGRFSHYPTGFGLEPQGGMDKQSYQDDEGVWHGSFWNYLSDRPQNNVIVEGSLFRGSHELKFGYSWRKTIVESSSAAPGNKIVTYHYGYPDMGALVYSDWAAKAEAKYRAAWIGDTITMDRMTINAGIRMDWQSDSLLATSEPAVSGFERWLPAISGKAVPNAIEWNSVSPRLGVSYALDEARKTQLRGSYANFASQLGNGSSYFIGVVTYRYIEFNAVDRNGNRVADPSEIDQTSINYWGGFDATNPSKIDESINKIGDYGVPRTHEIIFGVDRELAPNFGVSASYTWRRFYNFNWTPRIGVRADDYVQAGTFSGSGLPDGSSFGVPYYKVDTTRLSAEALSGGSEYVKREGYHQRFWGIELSATKRLANRWMARFGFSTNDHREYFDDPSKAIQDPTPGPTSPNKDGGLTIRATGGSGKSGIYLVYPKYQFILNGLYQAPYGIDLGLNMVTRQGYAQPWFQSNVVTGDYFSNRKRVLLVGDVGENRLPMATSFDMRVGKVFKFNRVNMNIDLDIFNALNAGTVLGRQYDKRLTGATGFDQVLEIMNPRILRVGLRASF